MIDTPRLRLVPATLAHFAALGESEDALAALLEVRPATEWLGFDAAREAMVQAGAYLIDHPEAADWWTYWFVHPGDARLIGLGGFKGAPADGAVEIGYAVAPAYRGQGIAREAAQGLVDAAFSDPQVQRVLAHTLPEPNASTSVLTRLGFQNADAIVDPEDGLVWRWELARPA